MDLEAITSKCLENQRPKHILDTLFSVIKYHSDADDGGDEDSDSDGDEGERFFYVPLSELTKHNITLGDVSKIRDKIFSRFGEGYIVDRTKNDIYFIGEKDLYASKASYKDSILLSLVDHMFNDSSDPSYA